MTRRKYAIPLRLPYMVLLLVWGTGFCQDKEIDSLAQIITRGKKDTSLVVAMNALSVRLLQNERLAEAVAYADKAQAVSAELKYPRGQAYALKNRGMAEYYRGNYKAVLNDWTESLQIFETIGDTLGIANIANNLGAVFYAQGSHDKALGYYFKSLRISEKLKDPVRITSALVNIGGVYAQMQDFDKALNFYTQVEDYLQKLKDPLIQSTYLMGIGEVYSQKGDPVNAIKYYKEALAINKTTQDYAHNLTMIGREEFKLGNRTEAIGYLDSAYATARNSDISLDQVQTLLAMGDVYRDNNAKMALNSYRQAESLAVRMETNEELRDIYDGMSKVYMSQGDFKSAYEYQQRYIDLNNKIFNIQKDDKIRGLQFSFDLEKKEDQIGLLEKEAEITRLQGKRQQSAIYLSGLISMVVLLLAIGFFYRYRYAKRSNELLSAEKNRSDSLLRNILPEATAQELRQNGRVKAKRFDSVTVLFADFKGFTEFSAALSPEDLVKSVDHYFSAFDEILDKYDLEKIKTIGDAYMCAGGLPYPSEDHAVRMVKAAFDMAEFMKSEAESNQDIMHFEIRIGINTGPVVAGVVGVKKFAYDIWGDTVNVAARMESMSRPGSINVSESTYKLIRDHFECEKRGEIFVKNKGMMNMYFVNGIANTYRPSSMDTSSMKL